MQIESNRDYTLDTAKAIAISLVLVWHLQPFEITNSNTQGIANSLNFALDFFYYQISLVAVPIFTFVSIYILHGKLNAAAPYISRRFRQLLTLYITWTSCQFACFFSLHVYNTLKSGRSLSWPDLESPFLLLMLGGPAISFVGGSVFYYLFILICLSGLTALFYTIIQTPKLRYVVACITAVLFLFYFQVLCLTGNNIPYWRLDNFLIYIPITYLVRQHEQSWNKKSVIRIFEYFIIFTCQDVFIKSILAGNGAYSRVSVVFGSVALYALLRVYFGKPKHKFRIITFLAKYSLGIFAIHKYWQFVINLLAEHFRLNHITSPVNVSTLGEAIICIALTCWTVQMIGHTRFRYLVS